MVKPTIISRIVVMVSILSYVFNICLQLNSVTHSKGHSPDKADLEEQSGDGWTVFTGRKSRSPSFNPTNAIKAAGRPSPGRADELCDIQEMCPPSSFRQGNGDATRQYNGDPTKQALNIIQLASPENGETLVQETASVVQESAMQEVILTSAPQDSSYSVLQNAESSKSLLVNNSLSSHVSPKAASGNEVHETEQSPQAEEHLPAQNSSASGCGNPLLHNVLNMDDKVPNIDALSNTTVPSCTGQQPLQPFFPVQPFPFRGIPAHVVAQYLASLVLQPNIPPENRLPNSSAPLRPPPGLNTEPVPEEEPEQLSPSTHPPGKSSSFDKLMEALRKRFPNKSR